VRHGPHARQGGRLTGLARLCLNPARLAHGALEEADPGSQSAGVGIVQARTQFQPPAADGQQPR
jgi:hypothetical protein